MTVTYREVAEILKLIDASDCDELELEFEDVRLVVRRRGGARVDELRGITPAPDPAGSRAQNEVVGNGEVEAVRGGASDPVRPDGQLEVRAPMVGTFYRAPSPGEPPFVEKGGHVERGTPLCLIEVMKLFTTIESTLTGRVAEVLVDDATLVEYGQPLFVIDPEEEARAGDA